MFQNEMTAHEWALTVLRGVTPRRLLFVTRLETRDNTEERSRTLPERFQGLTLTLNLFLRHNSIERVETIARRVEDLDLPKRLNVATGMPL